MTNQPYEGATPEQLAHPMVQELLAIHNMFRTQLAAMLEYIHDLISGEKQLTEREASAQIQAVVRAGRQYSHHLHTHHHLETAMLFPPLLKVGVEAAVIDRLNADHDEIAVMIDKFSDGIREFAAIDPQVMNTDLRRLAEALLAHLAYEETHVCPFMTRLTHQDLVNHSR